MAQQRPVSTTTGPTFIQPDEPPASQLKTGYSWLDTLIIPWMLKTWDGEKWIAQDYVTYEGFGHGDAYLNQASYANTGIDSLTFATDAISSIASGMSGGSSRNLSAAFATWGFGYWCGGYNSTATLLLTNVDRLIFGVESVASIVSTLGANRSGSGLESGVAGYGLRHSTILGSLLKLTFSGEITSDASFTIIPRIGGAAISGPYKGYILGGQSTGSANDPTSTIQTMSWSSEIVNTISTTLTQQTTYYPAGSENATTGYRMGGGYAVGGYAVGGTGRRIEKIQFSDDSIASISTQLGTDYAYQYDGVHSYEGCYSCGGFWESVPANNQARKLTFSSDTMSTLISTISSVNGSSNFEGIRFPAA